MRRSIGLALAGVLLAGLFCVEGRGQERPAGAAGDAEERVEEILTRVGERVERYLGGMFSIAFSEVLRSEELRKDLTPKGKPKEYVFDNIVLREQRSADDGDYYGKALRRLLTIDGKSVKPSKQREELDRCGGPGSSYEDPLTFLLPKARARLIFTYEGEETLLGRRVHRLGYVPRERVPPGVSVKDDCFYARGMAYKGTLWVDAENFDVLQTASRLVEEYEFESPRALNVGFGRFGPKRKLRYVRAEHSMRFSRVRFREPEQELLLPESYESLRIIRGAREPRVRFKRSFENYRRYVSDVKIIEDEGPQN